MTQSSASYGHLIKEIIKTSDAKAQDVSIVATFHREGLYAHWMLTEFEQTRKNAQENGISVQLICVLDNPDEDTKLIVKNHKFMQGQDIIVCVSTADLGTNRNVGIELAQGEFIGTADADDYMGRSWISNAYQLAKEYGASVAIHPEYHLLFGEKHALIRIVDQRFVDFPAAGMVHIHPWVSRVFAHVAVFKSTPYQSTRSKEAGYGFEDWQWNLEILSKGVSHICAPDTAFYYRTQKISLSTNEAGFNSIIRSSRFFEDPECWDTGFELIPELRALSKKTVPQVRVGK